MLNEDDHVLMESIADDLCKIAPKVLKVEGSTFHCAPVEDVSTSQLLKFIQLLELNLDGYYKKHVGENWLDDKEEEMQESGLCYAWYTIDKKLVSFISFKLCYFEGIKVLYLYEIHVHPKFQGLQWGSKILSKFHEFPAYLNKRALGHLNDIEGVSLTVFSSNEKALKWYVREGYTFTKGSPRDKNLRGGVVKPDFYLLIRAEKLTSP